ncbi:MAG: hypothetical protein IBX48_09590 [Thiomicrospira sp.]|uniref:hypothetical protein n=1 Tax=Thiomicrospira sp. TaxID=935 RepID=UPI0019D85426|nr:hypothetical protein [Thiomicrospira sp.]MBE0494578.1 hypothetical protein [Thiomicrospira sp.]
MSRSSAPYQQGYALLLLVLMLFMAGSAMLYSTMGPQANKLKHQASQKQMTILEQVKTNLLLHAVSAPEIYATNSNGNFYTSDRVPSPGYLPCPDINNNGSTTTPCGQGEEIVIGRLPAGLATRHFRFIDNRSSPVFIWYVVDSRYVIQNPDYNNPPTKRYAPLNSNTPGNGRIQLDNQTDLVALIFISEQVPASSTDLSTTSLKNLVNPSQNRFTRQNTRAVTISHQEWRAHVQGRVQNQSSTLCQLDEELAHWFNECNNPDSPSAECPAINDGRKNNPVGSNWRALLCS